MKEENGGFTLVEVLVTVLCSSLIMMAVVSFMLVGLRTEVAAEDTAREQTAARIVMSVVEESLRDGTVDRVEQVGKDWLLWRKNNDGTESVFLSYNAADKTLSAGQSVMMEGITAFNASLVEKVLSLSVSTAEDSYESAVYCRTAVEEETYTGSEDILEKVEEESGDTDTSRSRYKFLAVLSTQYDSSGEIKYPYNNEEYQYFSEWYIGGYDTNPVWSEETPWCACFLSWGAAQVEGECLNPEDAPRFAKVEDGMEKFQTEEFGDWKPSEETPIPGDFIFFDWDENGDPEHIGAVLYVNNGRVYTIEGNSDDKVAVHSYDLRDPSIMGYGVLKWKSE